MRSTVAALLGAALCCSLVKAAPETVTGEAAATEAMKKFDAETEKLNRRSTLASWIYESDITDENSRKKVSHGRHVVR